ncbi:MULTISPECIES: hypothetical protein [Corynebacterium]|uniref:hypothetical protein n=1 Tax=Corynebacterium TaxID=1716 RepID=UPI0003B8AB30|nr:MULTISPECIES: hypothetical protein [Corynebacterium]ERS41828.1 hypothetical protein HMPREF1293_01979 [Corynebacterium sp. KPL1996]ERS44657.1 hypothetical protein HMPREF1287_01150 [Corynebacterium sp. KPL1986]ERS72582.1 hypothetical protein HMPREF1295_01509 [Corynebacterium sp. KPL1998]ERS73959.1 hypothetical protein HMPREF1300_00942 [Corynebacterium sp. KPL2004]MCT1410042.1 hypothetical protein [Corynebacterium accolens]
MSLNYHELFKQMAATPQVKAAPRKKAEQVKKYIELRWPEVNEMSERDRAFLDDDSGEVVKITHATRGTNRPTQVVTVRHPGAVAKQAKDGFITKAVKDAS